MTAFVRVGRWLGLAPKAPDSVDGFGQSLADDLRFALRVRAGRRRAIAWRAPSDGEARSHDAHPVIGRFGDWTYAVADHDGRRWIARERAWHGWPDAPHYALFVLAGDAIWAAADLGAWPPRWRVPAA